MFGRICNPTASNISICDAKNKRIANPYTRFSRITNPTEQGAKNMRITNPTEQVLTGKRITNHVRNVRSDLEGKWQGTASLLAGSSHTHPILFLYPSIHFEYG